MGEAVRRRLRLVALIGLAAALAGGSMARAQEPVPHLAVTGVFDNATLSVQDFRARPLVALPGQYDELGEGPFGLHLLDALGSELFVRFFTPETDVQGTGQFFGEIVPRPPGAAFVMISHEGSTLHMVGFSASPPSVQVLSPNGGESLSGEVEVSWTASDADGDPLRFDVLYSRDGGGDWDPLGLEVEGNTLSWDTDQVGGGADCLIRVVASDGLNAAEDRSDLPFSVSEKGPMVEILAPPAGHRFFSGQLVVFRGYAYDLEDGQIADDLLEWESDRDGALGVGQELGVPSLSPGEHVITLRTVQTGIPWEAVTNIHVAASADSDGDLIADDEDNCPTAANPDQANFDFDLQGDACDDSDGDTYVDRIDNCPRWKNDLTDTDGDGIGDGCECGDFNRDGRVNTSDARLIQRCAVGEFPCSGLCDATGEGTCNTTDARLIQRLAVGQLSKADLHCAERP